MADMIISAGGGGAGSDDCTATKAQVLSGYTAVTKDSDDEPVEGTMANRGAVTQALNAGGSYTVPAGYHNGSGKITANSLASQTGGATAGDGDVLTGKTYWKDGAKRTGTMANQGAKTSSLNCGGSYTIPAGYHNGSGKVTANSLSSQTSATATSAQIISGKTAWVNGSKLTGTLAVTSAITFSAAALSYNTIRISWKNPAKGPWQGVFIQMSTSGSPGTGGGSRAYTGAGNNPNQAGGSNYVDIGGLTYETVYYFTCTSYCDGLGWGNSANVSVKTAEWWDVNSEESMRIWATPGKFDSVLADVHGRFKNMVWSDSGAKAIANSSYALNKLSKNKSACTYANLSPTIPDYFNTIASNLNNTEYFGMLSNINAYARYSQNSSSGYNYPTYLNTKYPFSGTTNREETAWESGVIILITSYKYGYNGVTDPPSGYSGVDIYAYPDQQYETIAYPLVNGHGRYWRGYPALYDRYVENNLSNTWNKRFTLKNFNDGQETITKNVVCFGPAELETSWNDSDKSGTVSAYYYGKFYTSSAI